MTMEEEPVKSVAVTAIDDRNTGSRARQTIAAFNVSLGMVMFGYSTGWISPTVELFLSSDSPVEMSTAQLSWVMGGTALGGVLCALPATLLMSRLGRRGTLLLLHLLPSLSWILIYHATSFPLLIAGRLLAGSWIGTCFTIVPIYISEMVDPEYRSSLNTLPGFMHRLGTLAVFTLGTYSSYQTLSVVGFALTILYFIVLITVPESPYYYLMKNNKEKAFQSVAWLQNNNNIDEKLNKLNTFINSELDNKVSIFDLIENPTHLKNVLVVSLATVFTVASGGILLVILPIVIPENSIPYLSNGECSIIGAVISLLFSFRPKCLSFGSNKLSIMISGTICGICMAMMASWYYFENNIALLKEDLKWVPVFCFFIHIVFYSMYMYPIVLGLRGEVFPTKYKNNLSAFVAALTTVTISVVLHVFIPIKTHWGAHYNFIIGCVCSFSLVLLSYFCLIETEGKSLQEIQDDLNSPDRGKAETSKV